MAQKDKDYWTTARLTVALFPPIPRTITGKVSLLTNYALQGLIVYSALVGQWEFVAQYFLIYALKQLRDGMMRRWIRPIEIENIEKAIREEHNKTATRN